MPLRPIGRTTRLMPAVLWGVEKPPVTLVIERCITLRADWFYVPASVSDAQIATMRDSLAGGHVVLGMNAADFARRSTSAIDARLAALGRATCDAVVLQNILLAEVKEGRTFQRVAQLRDRGRIDLCFVDSSSAADAEWLLRHTPAHGVMLDFGIGDQTAGYRILPEALEIGTGILARRPPTAIWSVQPMPSRREERAFVLSDPAVTALLEPLPAIDADLSQVLDALQSPMPAAAADEYRALFHTCVREPAPPRGAHPPEWA